MSDTNTNNVDQIRDLIFGTQIKDFEEKFNHLTLALNSMEETMKGTFTESYSKLQKETERSLDALEKKIDNLSSSTQKERAKLKELMNAADETLQDNLNNQKDEFTTKFNILKENISDDNNNMAQSIASLKNDIYNTLEAKLATLSDAKLSRDSMAQMLLDVAMKIQGTDVSMLLTEEQKTGK